MVFFSTLPSYSLRCDFTNFIILKPPKFSLDINLQFKQDDQKLKIKSIFN